MLYFEYFGHDPYSENRFRQVLMSALVLIPAILLYPFTILGLFLWGLWRAWGRWAPAH